MPDLRVVAERSAEEIKKQEAIAALKAALVDLAGNLIRVVRGAGRPQDIIRHLNDFASAFNGYSTAHGHGPSAHILGSMVKFDPDLDMTADDDHFDLEICEQAICRSALQIVASTLLDQRMPRSQAEGEMQNSIRRIEELRTHLVSEPAR